MREHSTSGSEGFRFAMTQVLRDLSQTLNPKLHALRPNLQSVSPTTTGQVAALFQALGRPLASAERRAGSPEFLLRMFGACRRFRGGFVVLSLAELLVRS